MSVKVYTDHKQQNIAAVYFAAVSVVLHQYQWYLQQYQWYLQQQQQDAYPREAIDWPDAAPSRPVARDRRQREKATAEAHVTRG